MSDFKFEMGDEVRDRLTGVRGVIVARTEWINGCKRMCVQPRTLDKKGNVVDSEKAKEMETVDEQQLDLIKAKVEPAKKPKGGPMPQVRMGMQVSR
jgi:hypothetical protein